MKDFDEFEIQQAGWLLNNKMHTVDDLITFWIRFGPTLMVKYPEIEHYPGGWMTGIYR